MEVQLLNILMLINSNILMPRLVVLDGLCVLHGGIYLTLASITSRYIARAPLSNSSESMHIIVFKVAGLVTYLCMMSALMGKSWLVAMHIN